MNAEAFFKDCLRGTHCCSKWVFEFNCDPAGYVDCTHVPELTAETLSFIRQSQRGRRKLSRYLADKFELQKYCFEAFAKSRTRLALVSAATLQRLLYFAGTAYYKERICHLISKDQVTLLKEKVGEKAYLFAVKRAPFLMPKAFSIQSIARATDSLQEDVVNAGKECIELYFADEPKPLLNRLKLKFPAGLSFNFNKTLAVEERAPLENFLHRILFRELGKEWKPCFN